MTDKSLNVGVIGTGFIGPAHVEGLRRLGIEVSGVLDISPESARSKADFMHIERVFDSLEEMCSDPDLNVIHITSPNYLHHEHAKAALLAGKHVVCEKPLAMDSSQSAELLALAEEKGLVTAVNFNLRFYPLVHQARAMVRSGELGEVHIIQGSYLQDWLLLPTDWNWRLEPELGGNMRAVADIGSHWLDLTGFISGLKVEAVLADFATFLPVRQKPKSSIETYSGKLQTAVEYEDQPIHTEDYASILLRFKGGARGVLTVSQVSAGRKNRLFYEIDGSKSALAWDSERPNELWVGHRERPNELLMKDPALLSQEARQYASYPGGHNEGFPDTFKQHFLTIYRYIAAGDFSTEPDFPTFRDGHYGLVVGEAIRKSAQEGRWVSLP